VKKNQSYKLNLETCPPHISHSLPHVLTIIDEVRDEEFSIRTSSGHDGTMSRALLEEYYILVEPEKDKQPKPVIEEDQLWMLKPTAPKELSFIIRIVGPSANTGNYTCHALGCPFTTVILNSHWLTTNYVCVAKEYVASDDVMSIFNILSQFSFKEEEEEESSEPMQRVIEKGQHYVKQDPLANQSKLVVIQEVYKRPDGSLVFTQLGEKFDGTMFSESYLDSYDLVERVKFRQKDTVPEFDEKAEAEARSEFDEKAEAALGSWMKRFIQ